MHAFPRRGETIRLPKSELRREALRAYHLFRDIFSAPTHNHQEQRAFFDNSGPRAQLLYPIISFARFFQGDPRLMPELQEDLHKSQAKAKSLG